ncbi:MAG: hypothetical protein ACU4F9_06075 [Arcticibacter sp.]
MTTEEFWHFSGKYKGVFKTHASSTTHAAVFYDLTWVALEIREVKRISFRDSSKEKTGDFHYEKFLKPKTNWAVGGVDISIISNEFYAYSEKIYDVILLNQSDNRNGFSPVRKFQHHRTTEQEFIVEGDIYFSLPQSPVKIEVHSSELLPPATAVDPVQAQAESVVVNATPENSESSSDLLSRQGGCFSMPTSRPGCLNAGGCLSGILKLFRWSIIFMLLLGLLGYISNLLSNEVTEQKIKKKEGVVESSDMRLDPQQDTMSIQPWNYLVDHDVKWSDFLANDYHSKYSTSTHNLRVSAQRHEAWANAQIANELLFYHDLYEDLYLGDNKKLDSLVNYFSNQRKIKNLNTAATAEMVVTFVQEIPYVLIHGGTCKEACAEGGFIADYHAQGNPCVPNVIAGVYSPYEFIHTLDGDCDTRSLLAYSILDKLNIGASIWVSREYGHSVLGVAVPSNSSNYKTVKSVRYFAVELTSKGFRIGMIAPEHTEMNNWNVVLYNQ